MVEKEKDEKISENNVRKVFVVFSAPSSLGRSIRKERGTHMKNTIDRWKILDQRTKNRLKRQFWLWLMLSSIAVLFHLFPPH